MNREQREDLVSYIGRSIYSWVIFVTSRFCKVALGSITNFKTILELSLKFVGPSTIELS